MGSGGDSGFWALGMMWEKPPARSEQDFLGKIKGEAARGRRVAWQSLEDRGYGWQEMRPETLAGQVQAGPCGPWPGCFCF